MADRTPADVIAAAFSVGRGVTNSPEALAARVLDALAAAGFRVVPEPDDTTDLFTLFIEQVHARGGTAVTAVLVEPGTPPPPNPRKDKSGAPVPCRDCGLLYEHHSEPPGFTWGHACRLLFEQAQAEGHLVGWSLGFNDDTDSGGQAWPVSPRGVVHGGGVQ